MGFYDPIRLQQVSMPRLPTSTPYNSGPNLIGNLAKQAIAGIDNRQKTIRQDALRQDLLNEKDLIHARQAAQDARQAGIDKRNTPGTPEWNAAQNAKQQFAMETLKKERAADPEWKEKLRLINEGVRNRAEQKKVAEAFIGLPTNKTITTTTGVITQADVDADRQRLLDAKLEKMGQIFSDTYDHLIATPTPTTTKGSGYETDVLMGVTPNLKDFVKTPAPVQMSNEEAAKIALEKAGLTEYMDGKEITVDEANVKKLSKGTTKSISKKLSPEESVQNQLNELKQLYKDGKISATTAVEISNKINVKKTNAEKIAELEQARKQSETDNKIDNNYWSNKITPKSGDGSGIRTALKSMFDDFGDPGSYDRPWIENQLAGLQGQGYSDTQMKKAINASRGVFGNSIIGVDHKGFIKAVEKNLRNISK